MLKEFLAKKSTTTPSTAGASYFALYVENTLKQLPGPLRREAENRIQQVLHDVEYRAELHKSRQDVTQQQQQCQGGLKQQKPQQYQLQNQVSILFICLFFLLFFNMTKQQCILLIRPNLICYRDSRTGSLPLVSGQHKSRGIFPRSGIHRTGNGCRANSLNKGLPACQRWLVLLWRRQENTKHQAPRAKHTPSLCLCRRAK